MAFLAISYPELEPGDFEWIQSIRQQYDPHITLLDPHVTLVFEVDGVDRDTFISHIHPIVSSTSEISFVMRCVSVVKSVNEETWFLLMVPDEGNSDIIQLHDYCYNGILQRHLRLDIPFIPHITVGIFDNGEDCKAAADKLNKDRFEIPGRIGVVDIVSYSDNRIESLERIGLKNTPGA